MFELNACNILDALDADSMLPTRPGTLIAAPLAVLLDVVNLSDQKSQVNGEAVSTDVTYPQLEVCSIAPIARQCTTHDIFISCVSTQCHILGHRDRHSRERGLVGGIQSADIRVIMVSRCQQTCRSIFSTCLNLITSLAP